MVATASRFYPWAGFLIGYVLVLWANPIRLALRDGLRCITRFSRVWLVFALLGFAYSIFQFATFTPIQSQDDFDFNQLVSMFGWQWPRLLEVWREVPLPAMEGVAGIFDNATTTYPLSVVAALMLAVNWRGLHGSFLRALWKRFRIWSIPVYVIVSPCCAGDRA